MRRAAEWALGAVAVLVSVVFAGGAAGLFGPGGAPGENSRGKYYHGGKAAGGALPDAACQNDKCHAGEPHRRSAPEAAFRNMHAGIAECLGCHGKDPQARWRPGTSPGRKVLYQPPAGGGKPHDAMGRALPCRSCHSETGRAALERRGVTGLTGSFASPIALRMMEEKGKRWVTDEIR